MEEEGEEWTEREREREREREGGGKRKKRGRKKRVGKEVSVSEVRRNKEGGEEEWVM